MGQLTAKHTGRSKFCLTVKDQIPDSTLLIHVFAYAFAGMETDHVPAVVIFCGINPCKVSKMSIVGVDSISQQCLCTVPSS